MYYRCSPFKNVECGKRNCFVNGGSCYITSVDKFSTDGKQLLCGADLKKPSVEQKKILKRWDKKKGGNDGDGSEVSNA